MENTQDNSIFYQINESCIEDITIGDLLENSLNSTKSVEAAASNTEVIHQQFLRDEAVCNVVDDLVSHVSHPSIESMKKHEKLINFSPISSASNSYLNETYDEPNTQDIDQMIQNMWKATEPIKFNPPTRTPKTIYSNIKNETLSVETQMFKSDTPDQVDWVNVSSEDEENDENKDASKSSVKRQMNESIMSVGDLMIITDRKKPKESLDNSIDVKLLFDEDVEDKENCNPSFETSIQSQNSLNKSNVSQRSILKELEFCKEETEIPNQDLDDVMNNSNSINPAEVTFSIEDRFNLLQTKLDYENKIVDLKENVEGLQKKLACIDEILSSTKTQLEKQLLVHEQNVVDFNEKTTSYEQRIGNYESKIEELNQQLMQANEQIAECSSKSKLELTFTAEDRLELLQTKLSYEEELIQLKESHELLQQQLQESNEKINEKQIEFEKTQSLCNVLKEECEAQQLNLEAEMAKKETMYNQLLDAKVAVEHKLEDLEFKFAELSLKQPELCNAQLQTSVLEESFTLEDRQELLQIKIDYETLIAKLNDQIDSLQQQSLEAQKEKDQQLGQLVERIERLNSEKTDLEADFESTKESLNMKIKTLAGLNQELSVSAADNHERLEEANTKVESLLADKARLQNVVENKQIECEQIKQENAKILAELSSLSAQLEALGAAKAQADETNAKLDEEILELKLKIENAETSKARAMSEMSAKHQEEMNALSKMNESLEINFAKISEQKKALLQEMKEVETNYWNLSKTNDSIKMKYEREIGDLKQQLGNAETELNKLAQQSQVEASQAKDQIENLAREVRDLSERVKMMKHADEVKSGKHEKEMAILKQDKQQLESKIEELACQLDQSNIEKNSLAARVAELSESQAGFAAELERFFAQQSLDMKAGASLVEQIRTISNAFQNKLSTVEVESQLKLAQLENKLVTMQDAELKLAQSDNKIAQLSSDLEKQQAAYQVLQENMEKRKKLLGEYHTLCGDFKRRKDAHKATMAIGVNAFKQVEEESKKLVAELSNVMAKIDKNPGSSFSVETVKRLFTRINNRLNDKIIAAGENFVYLNTPEAGTDNPANK